MTSDSVPAPVSFRATFFITEQSAYPVAVYREYQWKDTDFSAFSYYPLPEHPDDYDVNNKAKGKKRRFNPSRDSEDEGSNPLSIGDMSVKVSGNDVSITLPPDFPIGNGNSSREWRGTTPVRERCRMSQRCVADCGYYPRNRKRMK